MKTYKIKPFEWEDHVTSSYTEILDETSTVANVWQHNGQYYWEIDGEFLWAKAECNSLEDGKQKAFKAWCEWLEQFLEEVPK